jgi:hypothetical protein
MREMPLEKYRTEYRRMLTYVALANRTVPGPGDCSHYIDYGENRAKHVPVRTL